jgi:hypothetical protein
MGRGAGLKRIGSVFRHRPTPVILAFAFSPYLGGMIAPITLSFIVSTSVLACSSVTPRALQIRLRAPLVPTPGLPSIGFGHDDPADCPALYSRSSWSPGTGVKVTIPSLPPSAESLHRRIEMSRNRNFRSGARHRMYGPNDRQRGPCLGPCLGPCFVLRAGWQTSVTYPAPLPAIKLGYC